MPLKLFFQIPKCHFGSSIKYYNMLSFYTPDLNFKLYTKVIGSSFIITFYYCRRRTRSRPHVAYLHLACKCIVDYNIIIRRRVRLLLYGYIIYNVYIIIIVFHNCRLQTRVRDNYEKEFKYGILL